MVAYPIPLTLHIGYPRTATTLFQKTLAESNDHILFLGRKAAKTEQEGWFNEKLYSYWEWIRLGKIEIDVDEAREHIMETLLWGAKNNKQAAVISDETMSKPHRIMHYAKLSQRLGAVFPNAKILLTIRNQIDLVFSLYGLELRRSIGKLYPIPTFDSWLLKGAGSNYVPIQERFNYAKLYSALLMYYDSANIAISFYEDFVHNPSKYIAELNRTIGVNRIEFSRNLKVNASPLKADDSPLGRFLISEGGGLYNLRFLNKFPRLIDYVYRYLFQRRIDWSFYGPNDDRIRYLNTIYYESNDAFVELSGLDLASYGYPTSLQLKNKYLYFGA